MLWWLCMNIASWVNLMMLAGMGHVNWPGVPLGKLNGNDYDFRSPPGRTVSVC
jgi:hypothetical protein